MSMTSLGVRVGTCACALSLFAGAVITVVAACGGSSSTDVTAPPKEAGGDDGSAADAGGGPYTIDNVCDRVAPIGCEIQKPCCEGAGGPGFDLAGCISHAKTNCNKDRADVLGGRATFHGDRIDGCIAKYKAIFANCTLTYDILQKYARDIAACQAFEGSLPEGATCERTSQCKPGATRDEIAGCDDNTKKCRITRIAGENAPCAIGEGTNVLCDDGLFCDADFATPTLAGTCKKKTAIGMACNKDKKPPLECGLGNYCDQATALCTAGKGGGATCNGNDLECASVTCTKPDAGTGTPNTCVAPTRLAKVEECKGP